MYQLVQHSPRSRDAFATAETAGRLQVPVRCLDIDLVLILTWSTISIEY